MLQELRGTREGDTGRTGQEFGVMFGAMVWDPSVRPSHQAVVTPAATGTQCFAATRKGPTPVCDLLIRSFPIHSISEPLLELLTIITIIRPLPRLTQQGQEEFHTIIHIISLLAQQIM